MADDVRLINVLSSLIAKLFTPCIPTRSSLETVMETWNVYLVVTALDVSAYDPLVSLDEFCSGISLNRIDEELTGSENVRVSMIGALLPLAYDNENDSNRGGTMSLYRVVACLLLIPVIALPLRSVTAPSVKLRYVKDSDSPILPVSLILSISAGERVIVSVRPDMLNDPLVSVYDDAVEEFERVT